MSYLQELKERYKQARKNMERHAIRERPVRCLPPPMPKPEPAPVAKEKETGLVSEKAEAEIVSTALNATVALFPHAQAYRMAEEVMSAPRLPPLPGLNLNEPGSVRWMRVLHAVAKQHDIQAQEIMGQSRKKHIVMARFETFYRLRFDLGMSYPKIASLFRRDHTSVLHGVNKVRAKLLDGALTQEENGGLRVAYHTGHARDIDTLDLSAA
jgi:hypothetical protein